MDRQHSESDTEHLHIHHPLIMKAISPPSSLIILDSTIIKGAVQGDHNGHDGHYHAAMITDSLQRLWVSLALTILVVAISPMFQMAVGYLYDFPGRGWGSVILGTII